MTPGVYVLTHQRYLTHSTLSIPHSHLNLTRQRRTLPLWHVIDATHCLVLWVQ
jgi:hypothetical protein